MKKFIVFAFALCMLCSFASCSDKQSSETEALNNTENVQSEDSSEAPSALDGEVFDKIPDEAVESFNYVTEQAKVLFPEADGEWMYGYKGTSKIGKAECYIFAVYTYKDEIHTKVGTVAKNIKNDDIYVLNETTGEYSKSELSDEKGQMSWAETETLAFIKK